MGLAVTTVAAGGLPVKDLGGPGGVAVTEVASFGLPVTKVAGVGGGMGVSFVSATGGAVTPPVTYATWNNADKSANATLTSGNLTVATTSSAPSGVRGNIGKSTGKYYWEATMTDWSGSSAGIGLATAAAPFGSFQTGQAVATKAGGGVNGGIYIDGTYSGSKISNFAPVNGDIAGVAVDLAAGLIWFRIAPSGNWNNSGTANPATGTGGVSLGVLTGSVLFPVYGASSVQTGITANFGASAFSGAVPSGFTSGWPDTSATVSYATWDAATVTAVTLSGGNLVATNTGTTSADQGAHVAAAAGKTSGKYYFEITWTTILAGNPGSNTGIGIGTPTSTYTNMGNGGTTGVHHYRTGSTYSNGSSILSAAAETQGEINGIAVDLDNRRFWYRKSPSGIWNNNASYDPATNTGGLTIPAGTMVPFITFGGSFGVASNVLTANFGASAFSGAVPSGFTSGWPS